MRPKRKPGSVRQDVFVVKTLRTVLRVLGEGGPGAVLSRIAKKIGQASRTMPGGSIRIGLCLFRSDATSRECLVDGTYEGEERFASKRYIRRDIPVVEFGGCLGVVACLTNRRLSNRVNHVVVEANPETVPILFENRDRNRCKFTILHGAAGSEGKSVRIYIGNGALAASSLAATDRSVEVAGITLSDILKSRGFDRCAFVCDIEGAEIGLIRSEMETFRSRVETFIVEYHPGINGVEPVASSRRLLKDHGFEELWHQRDVFVFRNTALADIS